MSEVKEFRAVYIVFSIEGAHADRLPWSQNVAVISGFHRMYSDLVSNVASQNYGHRWSVENLRNYTETLCATKPKVVTLFSIVCAS